MPIGSEVLEQVVRGAREDGTAPAAAQLSAEPDLPAEAGDAPGRRPARPAQSARDAGLSQRGVGLLIETTHDLSGFLSLRDVPRAIVSRARRLAGANVAWLTTLDKGGGVFRAGDAEGRLSPARPRRPAASHAARSA